MNKSLLGLLCFLQITDINKVSGAEVRPLLTNEVQTDIHRQRIQNPLDFDQLQELAGSDSDNAASGEEPTVSGQSLESTISEEPPHFIYPQYTASRTRDTITIGNFIKIHNPMNQEVTFRIVDLKQRVPTKKRKWSQRHQRYEYKTIKKSIPISDKNIKTVYSRCAVKSHETKTCGLVFPTGVSGDFGLIAKMSHTSWEYERKLVFDATKVKQIQDVYVPEITLTERVKKAIEYLLPIAVNDRIKIMNRAPKQYEITIREIKGDNKDIDELYYGELKWLMTKVKVRTIAIVKAKIPAGADLDIAVPAIRKGARYGLFKRHAPKWSLGGVEAFVREIKIIQNY